MASASRIELAPAYVLHQQPWRDSSRIYEVLTRDHGRLSLFARGVRGPKSRVAGLLQPFVPLLLSFSLRGEAGNLSAAEAAPMPGALPPLRSADVMSGWYLNELVLKLTVRHDPQVEIYGHYHRAITALRGGNPVARELRLFEKRLLESLGYGLDLGADRIADGNEGPLGYHYGSASVATLRSLAAERLDEPAALEEARTILRKALSACLEGRALQTRQVAEDLRQLRNMRQTE